MRRLSGWARAGVLTVAALACATATFAQVMEIRDDGTVVTYSVPTRYYVGGSQPMVGVTRQTAHEVGGRAVAGGGATVRSVGPIPSASMAQAIHDASARHQVDEQLVAAVARQESGFNPAALSRKGARGVMQLMPQTARALGVDANDPVANIDGGADYLSRMLRRFNGDVSKALAAYNAGPEAVERYRGVPPYAETTAYVRSVLARMNGPAVSISAPAGTD